MIRAGLLAAGLALAAPANAQESWGDLDRLLITSLLGPRAQLEGSWWLPDNADPALARTALGVTYFSIPGGGNSVSIATGYFIFTDSGWNLAAPVAGLFGHGPRDVVFLPDRIELTTTMPNPGDPRCCPTGEGRWSVDRNTGAATRLR